MYYIEREYKNLNFDFNRIGLFIGWGCLAWIMQGIKIKREVLIMELNLPVKDCKIQEYFGDAREPERERIKYCKRNCEFRCLRGLEYKKGKDFNQEEV